MWFVRIRGKVKKYSTEKILLFRKSGKLGSWADVSKDALNWISIDEVDELNPQPPQVAHEEDVAESPSTEKDVITNSQRPDGEVNVPNTEWYYVIANGQQQGPVAVPTIQQLIGQGIITRESLLFSESLSADWVVAEDIPLFSNQFPPENTENNLEPDRGTLILVLGLLGLLSLWPLGTAAWIMGSGDLKRMQRGLMDKKGEANTRVGYVLGIVSTLLGILAVVLICFLSGSIFLNIE